MEECRPQCQIKRCHRSCKFSIKAYLSKNLKNIYQSFGADNWIGEMFSICLGVENDIRNPLHDELLSAAFIAFSYGF